MSRPPAFGSLRFWRLLRLIWREWLRRPVADVVRLPLTSVTLAALDRWRHRIPFWWWLTYDVAVGVVIAVGVQPSDPAFGLGFAVLGIAVVIDAVEYAVKRPSARAKLAACSPPKP